MTSPPSYIENYLTVLSLTPAWCYIMKSSLQFSPKIDSNYEVVK